MKYAKSLGDPNLTERFNEVWPKREYVSSLVKNVKSHEKTGPRSQRYSYGDRTLSASESKSVGRKRKIFGSKELKSGLRSHHHH
jgi:hypothetical protein